MQNLKDIAKKVLLFLPAVFMAIIYFLLNKNKNLKQENAELKFSEEFKNRAIELEKQREIAKNAEDDYLAKRAELIKSINKPQE